MADIAVGVIGAAGMGSRHAVNLQRHVKGARVWWQSMTLTKRVQSRLPRSCSREVIQRGWRWDQRVDVP